MDFDPVAYLAGKGVRGRPASGGREMTYPCFLDCAEPADSRKRKLYLNVTEGVYHCKVCGAAGGSWSLQRHFGDEPRAGTSNDAFMRRRILDAAVEVGETMLANNDDPMLYLLNERGLAPETIVERRLGFIAGGWSLVGNLPEDVTAEQVKSTGLVHRDGAKAGRDFFWRHLLIPVLSRGHCIQMRARAWGEVSGGKYFSGPGEVPRLYNADAADGADEVIVTEGEFDCMLLAQELAQATDPRVRNIAVVGLPGTNAIPDEFDAVLSDAKRIYLGLDSDDPGRKAAESLKERIGARARILALPYEDGRKCDWTEYLLLADGAGDWKLRHPYAGHTWRDVRRLLSSAVGKRIKSMTECGEDYRAYRAINSGLKTGYARLDAILNPGLLPGQVLIFLAKTGAGKTVFLCNLAYQMRRHRQLFISLEMTREEVYERLRRIYLFYEPRATDDEVELGLSNIWICDENRLAERDVAGLVDEYTVEVDAAPEIVHVDYLGYFARGAKGQTPYEKATQAVMALKAIAKAGRLVVITPSQVNRVAKEGRPIDIDDARDSGAVEETADFLLSLHRPDEALAPSERTVQNVPSTGLVTVNVLKSRHGGKGKSLSLQMDMLTLAMVEASCSEASRARQHTLDAFGGKTWDQLRAEETAPQQLYLVKDPPT